jgi:hypothetical protein
MNERKRKLIILTLALLAGLFLVFGIAQYFFVSHQLRRTVVMELDGWATGIQQEIQFVDHWNLQGYRRAFLEASNSHVITSDGTIIEIDGFLNGLIQEPLHPTFTMPIDSPATITSSLGESWRMLAKKVEGGVVIVGVATHGDVASEDALLQENLKRFGTTFEAASKLSDREIDWTVDYAVLDNGGRIGRMWGGIPLQAASGKFMLPDGLNTVSKDDKTYAVFVKTLRSEKGKPIGQAAVHRDTSITSVALRQQIMFTLLCVVLCSIAAVLMVIPHLLARPSFRGVREVLAHGEDENVEFKASLQWDVDRKVMNPALLHMITRSVCGFLNSAKGGQVVIGVKDDGFVLGLHEDIKQAQGSSVDGFQKRLSDLLDSAIGSDYASLWSVNIEEVDGKTVCLINVCPSHRPAYLKGDKARGSQFYIRSLSSTRCLDTKESVTYMKDRWG